MFLVIFQRNIMCGVIRITGPHGTHTRPALATQVAVSILICYEVTRESEIIAELSRLISVHRD